ncbi:MAG: N-acetylglucosaminyl-diphospho-decaprenol L-rhamnosyltransferase [Pseudonocardiales bacterium]|jgi:N-acetylglucosaminyl-diphospho-decaprenol L-rhamnosyltransferase|nr:N-acetylglucosaminyl-diphospho-decaprenol L-rhamnosyltransferase [Pseudonocardiales bacterium]
MSASETLAVVVVTYAPGPSLATFLDSLQYATSRPLDVVLADNTEGDASDPAVREATHRAGVRVLPSGRNVGYGRAANAGVAATDTEFVVIANPDVAWESGSLDELLAATARWPRGASFGPLIHTPERMVYPSARELPSLGRGIGHALCGWWWPGNPWTAAYRRERGNPVERPAGWLSGSCLLVRRAAFDLVGGFDPGYFMYFEDTDLGERLGRAGWQNVYVPSAVVVHTGGHATERDKRRMLAEHHRSAWRYLSRRYAGWRWAPVRWVLRVGLAARAFLAMRSPRVAAGAAPQQRT